MKINGELPCSGFFANEENFDHKLDSHCKELESSFDDLNDRLIEDQGFVVKRDVRFSTSKLIESPRKLSYTSKQT